MVTGTVTAIMGLPAASTTAPEGIKTCCGAPIPSSWVWLRTMNSISSKGSHSVSASVRLADSPRRVIVSYLVAA